MQFACDVYFLKDPIFSQFPFLELDCSRIHDSLVYSNFFFTRNVCAYHGQDVSPFKEHNRKAFKMMDCVWLAYMDFIFGAIKKWSGKINR